MRGGGGGQGRYQVFSLGVRGNSVSPGYFRRPQATQIRFGTHLRRLVWRPAAHSDSAGWFHTGDVVEVLPAGAVKVRPSTHRSPHAMLAVRREDQ